MQTLPNPTVLYGRAERLIPGRGRNIRGRYSQTNEELRQTVAEDNQRESDLQPPAAVAACAIALEEAQKRLQDLQRHHRERWVQHHLYMRMTAVWEEDMQQSTRSLHDTFLQFSQNLRAACQAHPYTSPTTATLGPAEHSLIVPPAPPSPPQVPERPRFSSPRPTPATRSDPGSDTANDDTPCSIYTTPFNVESYYPSTLEIALHLTLINK